MKAKVFEMIIAVASGKGGTGKTTVATSLARVLQRRGEKTVFLDADVEAPNAHLYLAPDFQQEKGVDVLIPEVNESLCSGCGQCGEVCQYSAIVVLDEKPLVFPSLCHGCGSCTLICPEGAIQEIPHPIGILEGGMTAEGVRFGRGLLDIGKPLVVPIIAELKKWQQAEDQGWTVIDAPPGASCPVVESLRGADFALLVTEPTPFGLHDLRQAQRVTEEVGVPSGVIINRDGIGDDRVEAYCRKEGLPILMRIPYQREIGEGIARGKLLVEIDPAYYQRFEDLVQNILTLKAEGARS